MKNTVKKTMAMMLTLAMGVNGMITGVSAANAETKYGDLDRSGVADVSDLSALSLYLIGDCELDEAALKNADVNCDGKVDLADLAEFKSYLSKQYGSVMNGESNNAACEKEPLQYSVLSYSMTPSSIYEPLNDGDCFIYYLKDKDFEKEINEDIKSVFGENGALRNYRMDVTVVNGFMNIRFSRISELVSGEAEFNYDLRNSRKSGELSAELCGEYFDNDQVIEESRRGFFNEYIDLRSCYQTNEDMCDSDVFSPADKLYNTINEQAENLRADDIHAAHVEAEFGERRPVRIFRPWNYADSSLLDVYMSIFESKIEAGTVTPYMFDMTTGKQISISDIFGDSFAEYDGKYEIVESNREDGYVWLVDYNNGCYEKVLYDFSTLNPKYSSFADFQSGYVKVEDNVALCSYSVRDLSDNK